MGAEESRERDLAERLARLDKQARDVIWEEARKRRDSALKRDRHRQRRRSQRFDGRGWDDGDEEELSTDRGGRTPASLHDWALRVLEDRERAAASEIAPAEGTEEGRVVAVGARHCFVRSGGQDIECLLSAEMAEQQQTLLAVGDRVAFARRPGAPARLATVYPRSSRLSRPDPMNPGLERVVVANVERVVVVASLARPPFRPGLVDRYIIAIERGGAVPVLVVNKADLAGIDPEADAALAQLEVYRELGVKVILCSASAGEGVEALRRELQGHLAAFVGHSGVGKSSLINALCPELALTVGATNEVTTRGRHTTTRSALYESADGLALIDTPGVRSFGLLPMDTAELRFYFDDLTQAAAGCRFSDCTHTHEPGCAVDAAAEAGEIAPARLAAYRRILESLEG